MLVDDLTGAFRLGKVLTTPDQPDNGVINGIGQFQMGQSSSTGLGTLVLTSSPSYTNTTVLALGTLRL